MEPDEKRELYLEFLGEWQQLKRAIDKEAAPDPDERGKLDQIKQKLDTAKSLVFSVSSDGGTIVPDAGKRGQKRGELNTRIEALKARIDTITADVRAQQ